MTERVIRVAEEREYRSEAAAESKRSGLYGLAIGFLAGAVVGAVTALLYAPAPGVETRRKIGEKMGDISNSAGDVVYKTKEAFEEARDKVGGAYANTKEKTAQLFDKAKDKLSRRPVDDDDDDA